MEREFVKTMNRLQGMITKKLDSNVDADEYIRTRLLKSMTSMKYNHKNNTTAILICNGKDREFIIKERSNNGSVKLHILIGGIQ